MKNNTDLLRPFDLEAAQRGEPILWGGQFEPATFVARARKGKTNIIERAGMHAGLLDHVEYAPDEYLHMAPLCWVEGRPVYKGDRLWCKLYNEWVTATGSRLDGVLNADGHELGLDRPWPVQYFEFMRRAAKLDLGRSTNLDVIQVQQDLAEAQRIAARARADRLVALAALQEAKDRGAL